MGVNLKNINFGEVQPICNERGIALCWSISSEEYWEWRGFWDKWCCNICNPSYEGLYKKYKMENKPFKHILKYKQLIKK